MQARWRTTAGAMAAAMVLGLTGCMPGSGPWAWQYAINAAAGEVNYLSRAVPIEQGLDDPDLTQEQRDKLSLVIKARDYAEQVIGLNVGSSYRTFVDLKGEGLAWNLSASRKDAIEAYLWDVPVVGRISYLGFFNYADALAQRDYLVSQGYDTFIYELDAFSTLGYLPDPVSSALLKRTTTGLADTVVHELLHNTVWSQASEVFNESLATFFGRTGGLEFLAHEFGSDSPLLQQAQDTYEDNDRINVYLKSIVDEVRTVYARDISYDEKIVQRETVFEAARTRFIADIQPLLHSPDRYGIYGTLNYNNAFLLVNVRYNSDLQVFRDVYDHVDHNWARSLEVFQQAARSSDPFAFLRDYVQEAGRGKRVSGVSGIGCRVSGVGDRVSGIGCRVSANRRSAHGNRNASSGSPLIARSSQLPSHGFPWARGRRGTGPSV